MMTTRRRAARSGDAVGTASDAEGRERGDLMAADHDMVCGAVRYAYAFDTERCFWTEMRGAALMFLNQARARKLRDF
jgi:hypothetical protein